MDAVQQLVVKPGHVATCEHMLGEYKAAITYIRQDLQELETHRQEIPVADYRVHRKFLKQTLQHLKLAHYHLLQAQELNLQVAASTDRPKEDDPDGA